MKDEILKKIDMAIITEEDSIPIYGKHVENTLFWSGLEDDLKVKIKALLQNLARESKQHKFLLSKVKKMITERN